ncbi:hypothetical protein [Stenotrophomonas maltophilia]|jgi:hypothetical protein|uniref:hypothetical protein n=1 Tax=Stenotrophomonas maltophilia TaxID=40324 RepID=UPI0015DE48BA|nr:hypothetical protein [Stenotrophomonas maltophilia]MCI1050577.1 hypothetical protein [Stenotrophomonas maltophilia]MDG9909233.1 hypothetical protein [Stenotrophomonas maltophilia]
MKTHDMASALTEMAKALKAMPNVELSSALQPGGLQGGDKTAEIAVSLATLASLSSYGKNEWVSVIVEYDLPIIIRPRDAARDVLGKLLAYLEENKSAREKLTEDVQRRSKSSNEVSNALRFLLGND